MLDESAKLYVAFRLASCADMCVAQSRHGKAKKVNDLHLFRDMPWMLYLGAPDLPCSRRGEFGWIVT